MNGQEISDSIEVVTAVRDASVRDEDERAVTHGTAMVSSGWGLGQHLPPDLVEIVLAAMEAGYGQALADIRFGRVDGFRTDDE